MKVENKFYTTEYEISSPYFKSDLPSKIEVVADIHYHAGVSQDLFKMIVRYVEETNPDFVICLEIKLKQLTLLTILNTKISLKVLSEELPMSVQ